MSYHLLLANVVKYTLAEALKDVWSIEVLGEKNSSDLLCVHLFLQYKVKLWRLKLINNIKYKFYA